MLELVRSLEVDIVVGRRSAVYHRGDPVPSILLGSGS